MIPAAIVERLAKLIPMLASDKDGEVIATVRAIARTLETGGSDFHALASSLTRARVVAAPAASGSGAAYSYADFHKQAASVGGDPDNADALSPKFGLPIYAPEHVSSWFEVVRHCLDLDRKIPKKHGGRFLRDFEVKLLTDILQGLRWPTNANASWIETVVARCHQARAAAAGQGRTP